MPDPGFLNSDVPSIKYKFYVGMSIFKPSKEGIKIISAQNQKFINTTECTTFVHKKPCSCLLNHLNQTVFYKKNI